MIADEEQIWRHSTGVLCRFCSEYGGYKEISEEKVADRLQAAGWYGNMNPRKDFEKVDGRMKRIILVCMAVSMLLLLAAGCQEKQEPPQGPTTTLMIYMMGSDLEPKAGAASADLEEIANSGIDLSRNKVVVCAGGSPYWHNETVNQEQINILALEEQGFVTVSTMDSVSMGTPQLLSSFLNDCHEKYPSDQYALILWDHGNGPVLGYGKDILYGNDALLLAEIAQAMEESVFGGDNKLAWVGFDACLMASAELSCTMADYADYLIASQEIEPAFGWDYSFLAQLGKLETPELLVKLTENYMAACDAYYRDRGYEHYDVTLSAVDLSYARDLERTVNALFSEASGEVAHYYDLLAMNRAQSRELGRATTGSAYDLVDLGDMAMQLQAQYPEAVRALLDVVEEMVFINAASMEGCCGMSLYYPFYNKHYYEKDWKTVYSQLNVFPEYGAYLEEYEETWLQENKLEDMTLGGTPEETAENTYSVTLSEDQAKAFGSAVYYIMRRESGDLYRPVYSSRDVTWENNTLTAKYDGMAIYVRTGEDVSFIPPLAALDQIDRLYRYSGMLVLANTSYKPEDLTDEELPEEDFSKWRYLLTLNSETGKVEMSGTVPAQEHSAQDLVQLGRIEEADLSQYGTIEFYDTLPLYITRYENGVIKPLSQWYARGTVTGYALPLAESYSFEYAPLADGEYYLMFEITDTQSGVYCTEMLPITVEHPLGEEKELPVTELVWEAGEDRVLLKEQDGVKLYLMTRDTEHNGTRYYVEAENANDYAVRISLGDVVVNGNLLTTAGASVTAGPHDFMYEELHFGIVEGTGELEALQSLTLSMTARKERSGMTMWPQQQLRVNVEAAPKTDIREEYRGGFAYDLPHLGAKAEKQILYESENLRLTLLGLGESSGGSPAANCLIYAENLSDRPLNFGIFGQVLNGYYVDDYASASLSAGMATYLEVDGIQYNLNKLGFDQLHSVTLMVAESHRGLWWLNSTECIWCPVELSQAGESRTIQPGELLWEGQDVKVYLYRGTGKDGSWYVITENNSHQDISLWAIDVCFDGVPADRTNASFYISSKVGAGQRRVAQMLYTDFDEGNPMPQEITFSFQIRSFDETRVIHTAAERVTLRVE